MDPLIKLAGINIVSVYEVQSNAWDEIYQGIADQIKVENNNQPNEKILFHGTGRRN